MDFYRRGAPQTQSVALVKNTSLFVLLLPSRPGACAGSPSFEKPADAIRHELNMDTRSCASLGEDRKEPLTCH